MRNWVLDQTTAPGTTWRKRSCISSMHALEAPRCFATPQTLSSAPRAAQQSPATTATAGAGLRVRHTTVAAASRAQTAKAGTWKAARGRLRGKAGSVQDGSLQQCLQQVQLLAQPTISAAITDEQVEAVNTHNAVLQDVQQQQQQHPGALSLAFQCGTWLDHPAEDAGFAAGQPAYGVLLLWPVDGGVCDYTVYEAHPNGLLTGEQYHSASEFEQLTSKYQNRQYRQSIRILGDDVALVVWLRGAAAVTGSNGSQQPMVLVKKRGRRPAASPAKHGKVGIAIACQKDIRQRTLERQQAAAAAAGDQEQGERSSRRRKRRKWAARAAATAAAALAAVAAAA